MPAFKITLAYDGTDFVGWQRQATGVSIQGVLEDALRELDGRDVIVHGAGRTDAGVHALGQVAGFSLERAIDGAALARALNSRLPDAIRVLDAAEVPAAFHPRFEPSTKTYRYRICNGDVLNPFERRHAWHVSGALDIDVMRAAATTVEGRHDFAAFQATGGSARSTERDVCVSRLITAPTTKELFTTVDTEDTGEEEISRIGSNRVPRVLRGGEALITYEITGRGFLRHMVRIIVGTLVEIGRGRWPADRMAAAIASRDRAAAGPTAPPHGLYLVSVEYGADSGRPPACG